MEFESPFAKFARDQHIPIDEHDALVNANRAMAALGLNPIEDEDDIAYAQRIFGTGAESAKDDNVPRP